MNKRIIILFLAFALLSSALPIFAVASNVPSVPKLTEVPTNFEECFDAVWVQSLAAQLPKNISWDGKLQITKIKTGFRGTVTYETSNLYDFVWSVKLSDVKVSDSRGDCSTLKIVAEKEILGTAAALDWYFTNRDNYGLPDSVLDPDISILIDGLAALYFAPEFHLIAPDTFVEYEGWEPSTGLTCAEISEIDRLSKINAINSGGFSQGFKDKFCKE